MTKRFNFLHILTLLYPFVLRKWPGLIFNYCILFQEQYKFCHESVIEYLTKFDMYANFQ